MQVKDKSIAELGLIIRTDWARPYFGARPYITALCQIHSIDDYYGNEPATHVIRYFLANAGQWRGEVARAVKAELKERIGLK